MPRQEILIVEDNPVNRELIREVLEFRGYTVLEAEDGNQALDCLSRGTSNLAIIDIQMPWMSGLELIRMIRSDQRISQIKCLALTAYAMSGDRERVLAAGFDAYLAKPFESQELVRTIEGLLAG